MSIWAAQGSQTAGSKTALVIVSTAALRPRILEHTYSNVGNVTVDSQFEIQCQRFTAAGTTTAVTPAPTDPSEGTPTMTFGSNATVEPTYTANTVLFDTGVNPRGLFRWTAYDPSAEIILPAAANAGVGYVLTTLGGAVKVIVDVKVRQ